MWSLLKQVTKKRAPKVPSSHKSPSQPESQLHSKLFPPGSHEPVSPHGLPSHGSTVEVGDGSVGSSVTTRRYTGRRSDTQVTIEYNSSMPVVTDPTTDSEFDRGTEHVWNREKYAYICIYIIYIERVHVVISLLTCFKILFFSRRKQPEQERRNKLKTKLRLMQVRESYPFLADFVRRLSNSGGDTHSLKMRLKNTYLRFEKLKFHSRLSR